MIVLLVSTIILKFFDDTEPRIYFSLESQIVPLALLSLVAPLSQTLLNRQNLYLVLQMRLNTTGVSA